MSVGSPLALKRVYFSGSCRLSCSQGLARALVCPPPSGDEELQIYLDFTAIFLAFFIPHLDIPETLTDEVGVVCFYLRKRYRRNRSTKHRGVSQFTTREFIRRKRSYCEKGIHSHQFAWYCRFSERCSGPQISLIFWLVEVNF